MSSPDMKYAIGSLRFVLEEEGEPYYQQLMLQIRQNIAQGVLSVGDRLPSTRSLALSLGVSRSTITRAYDQLVAEGVLLSEHKRGLFVALSAEQDVSFQGFSQGSLNQGSLDQGSSCSGSKKRFDSGIDTSVFPNKEWAASMRRSWLNPDEAILRGDYTTGLPALKVAIADYLYRVRGLRCLPEQIIVTAGSRDSLMLIRHTLEKLNGDMQWWTEEASYPPLRQLMSNISLQSNNLLLDEDGAHPAELSDCRSVSEAGHCMLLTPNRQYPLGMAMSSSRRQQWLRCLENTNQWLIEDDYDNEFVYQGRNEVPLMQLAQRHKNTGERVFFIGSLSKVLFRGLRLGFIVAPSVHVSEIQASQRQLGMSVSQPMQPVVADFMAAGRFDRHLNRMRRHYRMKRDFLLALLDTHLQPWFVWKKPRGGMHVLIEFTSRCLVSHQDERLDDFAAQQLLLNGISMVTLSSHYPRDQAKKQGFVLGFTGSTEENMVYLVNALRVWCDAYISPAQQR